MQTLDAYFSFDCELSSVLSQLTRPVKHNHNLFEIHPTNNVTMYTISTEDSEISS